MGTMADYVDERAQIYCACLNLGKSGDSLAVCLKSDAFDHGFRAAVNKWNRMTEYGWRGGDVVGNGKGVDERKVYIKIYCAYLLNLGKSGDSLAEYLKSDDFDHGFNATVNYFNKTVNEIWEDD